MDTGTNLTPSNTMDNSIGQVVPFNDPYQEPTDLITAQAGGGQEGQKTPDDVFSADAEHFDDVAPLDGPCLHCGNDMFTEAHKSWFCDRESGGCGIVAHFVNPFEAESFSAEYKIQINELLDNLYDVADNYKSAEPCDCTFEEGTDAEYTFHIDKCHLPYLENKYYDTIDKIWPILKRQGDIDPEMYEWLSFPLSDDGQDANLSVKGFVEQFPLDFEAESFSAEGDSSEVWALKQALKAYNEVLEDCLDGRYGTDDAESVMDDLEDSHHIVRFLDAESKFKRPYDGRHGFNPKRDTKGRFRRKLVVPLKKDAEYEGGFYGDDDNIYTHGKNVAGEFQVTQYTHKDTREHENFVKFDMPISAFLKNNKKYITIERDAFSAESLVEEPDWIPAGDGRALGQQNLDINLSPLHAEGNLKDYNPITLVVLGIIGGIGIALGTQSLVK